MGTLTIAGNYVGTGGQLIIRGVFGGSNSHTDQLVLSGGNATGSTPVSLVNVGGKGALTSGNGIPVVVAKNGATTSADAFTLLRRRIRGRAQYVYSLVPWRLPACAQTTGSSPPPVQESGSVPPPTPSEIRPEASLCLPSCPALSPRELGQHQRRHLPPAARAISRSNKATDGSPPLGDASSVNIPTAIGPAR